MTSLPTLVDTHAHLEDPRLKSRLVQVLRSSSEAGIVQIIAVATNAEDSGSVVQLARDHQGVFASVGIHPNDAVDARANDWETICGLARLPEVVALGETGLDRHWDKTPFEIQQDFFDRHLDLAAELDRPVIIHSRECHVDIVQQLARRSRPVRGVLHSFTGTWPEAQELLELGLHLSFAGMLTFANKTLDTLREAASLVPLDRLLVETDSPYLSPQPFRGQTNEPARVAFTAARLAEIRGISLQELAKVTTTNAQRLFALPGSQIIVIS